MLEYDKICLMIPTYKRYETKLPNLINSVIDTVSKPENVCFSFCVNVDDKGTSDYLIDKFLNSPIEYEIIIEETDQPNLALFWNMCYDQTRFSQDGTMVSMIGDDMIFQTKDWDQKILNKANETGGKCVLHCEDDYISHGNCCVNLFTTRKMVNGQKQPFMATLWHADMIDVVWFNVGHLTQTIHFFKDIVIKHDHETQKNEIVWDETMMRLAPIQQMSRTKQQQLIALRYSYTCAKNLILGGIGKWDKL